MPRYAVAITKDELKQKIESIDTESIGEIRTLTPQVEADLRKVEFDMENVAYESREFSIGSDDKIMGYQTLDNGFTFRGYAAGGDWECPVFFIIYWDGKKLRGYIPEDGNTYHKKSKKAYGNGQTADDVHCDVCDNLAKIICKTCYCCKSCCECGEEAELTKVKDTELAELTASDAPDIQQDKIIADIKTRILMR